jgi:protein-S-isoprenylcysteine O-methyltransferase Ste14
MANLGRNIAVSLLFTFLGGPALVLGYFPWTITHFRISPGEPPGLALAAALLIAAGLIPLLESIVRFITVGHGTLVPALPPEHLVVSGLYRYVRNPMYVGVLTVIAGEALLFRNRDMVAYLAGAWLTTHLFVCLYEESKLTRIFPAEYPIYKKNVPRWIPRLTPWNSHHAGESS